MKVLRIKKKKNLCRGGAEKAGVPILADNHFNPSQKFD